MKVGDLIKFEDDTGVVLQTYGDEYTQGMVLVLWRDGQTQWVACVVCEVINESR